MLGITQQCLILGSENTTALRIKNTGRTTLEIILATGKPHHKPFVKLLGHGGALVADTESHARAAIKIYEASPERFGY